MLLCLLLAAMTCLPAAVMAQEEGFVMTLPEKTRVIEDYAFSGNRQITAVNLPEGLLSIGAYAFDGCDAITEVYIPSSVEEIGEGAFPKGTLIACDDDSYAQTWIEENGYTRSRKYYALLIGQEYTGMNEYLPGCFRDVDSMQAMLQTMKGTDYRVTVCKDLTSSGITSAVASAFSQAGDNDVCLFYYSGHGVYSTHAAYLGALMGVDWNPVTMSRLKTELDKTTADKIIILDSCYSGAAIADPVTMTLRGEAAQPSLDRVNSAIISAFSMVPRAAFSTGGYYVMTAARWDENSASMGMTINGVTTYFGAFTYGVLYGSGYDEVAAAAIGSLPADQDGNGVITLAESYAYAYAHALTYNSAQHAQCYPADSNYALWAK